VPVIGGICPIKPKCDEDHTRQTMFFGAGRQSLVGRSSLVVRRSQALASFGEYDESRTTNDYRPTTRPYNGDAGIPACTLP
jgi:hypothetical protein